MLAKMLFMLAVSSAMTLLTFFIAKQSPKGEFRSLKYDSLPGIMTPETLKSRDAWVAAHTATAPYFLLLSVYYGALGAILVILTSMESPVAHAVFKVGHFIGIAVFVVLVWRGDRVAAKVPGNEFY